MQRRAENSQQRMADLNEPHRCMAAAPSDADQMRRAAVLTIIALGDVASGIEQRRVMVH
jgi:hypothetical protein